MAVSLNNFAVGLAFFSAAVSILIPLVAPPGSGNPFRFVNLMLCVPAVTLGMASWLRYPTFTRSLAIVFSLILMGAGILWVDTSELGRGMLQFAYIGITLPISALLARGRALRRACWVFVITAIIVTLIVIVLSVQLHLSGMFATDTVFRLGFVTYEGLGKVLIHPNSLAAVAAIAALFALFLYYSQPSLARGWKIFLALTIGYFTFCILVTMSRGASVSFAMSSLVMVLYGRKKVILIIFFVLFLIIIGSYFFAAYFGVSPVDLFVSRFAQEESVANLSNRTLIWSWGVEAFFDNSRNMLIGVGTGGAPKALGAEHYYFHAAKTYYDDDIPRLAAHSVFIEWLLSYGLLGTVFGLWMLTIIVTRSWLLDRAELAPFRRSILIFTVSLAAISTMLDEFHFVALIGVLFAMLSMRTLKELPVGSESRIT